MPASPASLATPAAIRLARRARGLTQWELARELGLYPNTVSRWERGVVEPSTLARLALAHVLGAAPGTSATGRRQRGGSAPPTA